MRRTDGGGSALGRLMGLGLLALVVAPSLSPWFSAAIDRGPTGTARVSWLPIALAVFDPFVWTCARNSAIIAALVAAGSMMVGVGLGTYASGRRFWGRVPLSGLGHLSIASGPLLIAPGVLILMGGDRAWDWLAARSFLGASCEDLGRWSALIWVGLATGVPIVAMATVSGLARVEPAWIEASRALGVSRMRTWREVTWPILKADVAKVAASLFVLNLVEPAGPMVLGLRRTLAVQMIDAARRLDEPTRAACLAVLSIAIAGLGRGLIRRWGGRAAVARLTPIPRDDPKPSRRSAWASRLVFGAWVVVGAGPVLMVMSRAFADVRGAASPETWAAVVHRFLDDPEATTWAINAGVAGLIAVVVDGLILSGLAGRGTLRAVVGWFEVVPPLALGVGAMALPWLLAAAAESSANPEAARWLGWLARELSPARSPGIVLILALAAGRLPMLARAAESARSRSSPILAEVDRALGVSPRRTVVPGRVLFLAWCLASTDLAHALLLVPDSGTRTLAPAAFAMVLDPEKIPPRAAGPIAILVGVNAVGLAFAGGRRAGKLGEWFRG